MPEINGEFFPEYTYQEYPKWITLPDGKSLVVESAHEEHKLLGTSPNEEEEEPEFVGFKEDTPIIEETPIVESEEFAPIEPVVSTDGSVIEGDLDALRDQADSLGVIYDKRWGAVKLQQAIDSAKARGVLTAE